VSAWRALAHVNDECVNSWEQHQVANTFLAKGETRSSKKSTIAKTAAIGELSDPPLPRHSARTTNWKPAVFTKPVELTMLRTWSNGNSINSVKVRNCCLTRDLRHRDYR